jgi:hypothetical protein
MAFFTDAADRSFSFLDSLRDAGKVDHGFDGTPRTSRLFTFFMDTPPGSPD